MPMLRSFLFALVAPSLLSGSAWAQTPAQDGRFGGMREGAPVTLSPQTVRELTEAISDATARKVLAGLRGTPTVTPPTGMPKPNPPTVTPTPQPTFPDTPPFPSGPTPPTVTPTTPTQPTTSPTTTPTPAPGGTSTPSTTSPPPMP